MMLVLIVETLNSAIEAFADKISVDRRDRLAAAKDQGSAAVFIALCITVLAWSLVLWH